MNRFPLRGIPAAWNEYSAHPKMCQATYVGHSAERNIFRSKQTFRCIQTDGLCAHLTSPAHDVALKLSAAGLSTILYVKQGESALFRESGGFQIEHYEAMIVPANLSC
jgi:hypothetical protein